MCYIKPSPQSRFGGKLLDIIRVICHQNRAKSSAPATLTTSFFRSNFDCALVLRTDPAPTVPEPCSPTSTSEAPYCL